eukprot:gnl/Dysnectes_brevis/1764_a2013_2470.p1 GENE.gnl/Dysnectes_brevis/1764_a2013_2470~~gnl/Dysnectes_brevis/1764_a2013_2470.p1  ORF type:complete len:179 (-),score=19.32 gnl/Dysnectes_brevis/1764_a2013_2470:125-661(-)
MAPSRHKFISSSAFCVGVMFTLAGTVGFAMMTLYPILFTPTKEQYWQCESPTPDPSPPIIYDPEGANVELIEPDTPTVSSQCVLQLHPDTSPDELLSCSQMASQNNLSGNTQTNSYLTNKPICICHTSCVQASVSPEFSHSFMALAFLLILIGVIASLTGHCLAKRSRHVTRSLYVLL